MRAAGPGASGTDAGGSGGCVEALVLGGAGFVVAVVAAWSVQGFLTRSWASCMDVAGQVAIDAQDPARSGILTWIGQFGLYWLCLPLGIRLTRRPFAARGRSVRLLAGMVSAALLLSLVFAGDLMLNLATRDGLAIAARCPAGLPHWWPHWIPARHPPNPCATGSCAGTGPQAR
jgi:hypothetical protein